MSFARLGSTLALLTSFLAAACSPPPKPPAAPPREAPVLPTAASIDAAVKVPRIEVAGATTPNLVRLGKDQEIVVRVRVRGLPQEGKKRPPLNLALVLDTSGSMEGTAIDQARGACATLIDLLAEGDTVAIVTFGSKAKVIVPSVRITKESRQRAHDALRGVTAEGTTDMAGGLAEGLVQIRTQLALTPDGIHRIVLVGDGVPNDSPAVLALADSAKAEHVPVTALGLGNDFDETLMTALAQRSSGTFHFVDEASRVAAVFKEQISRMERVVARGAHIELTPGPGVTIAEVVGMPSSATGRGQVATLGDLAEGQTRDVFVRVTAKGRQDGKSMELLDAHVTYTPTEGGAALTSSAFLKLTASSDAGRLKDAAIADIEHGVTTLRVADGIVKSIELAREGDLPSARKLLEATLRLAREGEKKFSDKALGERAAELTKLRKTLPSLAPPPEAKADGGPQRGAPRPAAASPEDAMELRAAHGSAMKDLQGGE
jgi:Ca-activated chloride channel homolog